MAGWRTTFGSPLFKDFVPDRDELIVERVRGAGVVVIGKTNVPEFAAGSHTFNKIFGTTLNPVDPSRSAGGSSGGAACALASGMVPLADGSDMGGSLRNPASFCGVVGLRPSLGRVPQWPLYNQWETTSVGGPMARNVGDLALLLSVMAGPDPRAPQALGDPGIVFAPPVSGELTGLRVAVSPDLGGVLEVDTEVAAVVEGSRAVFEAAGATVDATYPTLAEADDTFRTLRAWHFQAKFGALLAEHPDDFKAVAGRQHPRRRTPHRRRRGPRVRPAHLALGADARVLHRPRPAGPADLAGAAVPGRPGVPHRDQRQGDGDLPRLDAGLLPDHGDRVPGDLGAVRQYDGRAAGRRTARRSARRGPVPARGGGGARGGLDVSADEEAARYVREGTPPFVEVYDRVRDLVRKAGLGPGDPLPGEVALAGELGFPRNLVKEALLLLEEDGKVVRQRDRRWRVAPPAEPAAFTDSFHRPLGGRARPVRRLLVAIEDGSQWSHELLDMDGQILTWETIFAHDDVLLASTLEMMRLDAVPPELTEALDHDSHDLTVWPTMLEALGPDRRSGLTPQLWRLSPISRATERLSWMELPLHGIPAALTVVLAEDGVPVYLAKNIFDLGTFDLVVDQLGPLEP